MLDESLSSSPSFWALLTSWFTPTVFFVVLNITIVTIAITSSLTNQRQHRPEDSHTATHPQPLARSPSLLQRFKSINFYNYGSQEPTHQDPPEYVFGHTQQPEHPQITRSPSILQRLKSINLYNYFPTEPISAKLAAAADCNVLQSTNNESEKHHLDEPVVESEEENGEEDDVVGQIRQEEPERSLDEIYSQLHEAHVTRSKSDTKPAAGEVPVKLPKKMKKSATTKSAFAHFKEDDIVENRRPATARESKVTAADEEVDARADDFINKFKQQLKLQRLDSLLRYKDMISRGSAK